MEERKGIVGEYVVKNETKDGCVGGMRGEVMAVGVDEVTYTRYAFFDGDVSV